MNYIDDTTGASALPRHALVSVEVADTAVGDCADEDARLLMDELHTSHPVLLHWMHRKLGDRKLATELLNDAVLSALAQQRGGQLTCDGNLAGHVFKIGMTLLRQQRCKLEARPQLRLASDAAPPAFQETSAQAGQDERLRQAMRHLLESLSSQRDRQIVTQFYLDGADKKSLCREFAVSSRQFNAIVTRVRQRVKGMLDTGGLG